MTTPSNSIEVRPITDEEHLAYLRQQPSASFLQTPAWGEVKWDWRHESLGWFRDDSLIGVGLVLYRQVPKLKRYLAYLPEGPILDWSAPDLIDQLRALVAHVKSAGAFAVRIGPPVVTQRWGAATLKQAIADDAVTKLDQVTPDERDPVGGRVRQTLVSAGWSRLGSDDGFAAGQPPHVFQVPLAGRTEQDVLAGMNQLWRRNIKKAAKAGVEVVRGTADDLPAFHELYVETAQRDGFTPRPPSYFERMFDRLLAEDDDRIRLYVARHEGDLVAATTWVRVGEHAWYSYGASSTAKREVRGSNAVQWQMIRDALEAGATTYDLRGITDTLDSNDPHVGLIQFKVGTGGEAVEYVGEWELAINKLIAKAFNIYMSRR